MWIGLNGVGWIGGKIGGKQGTVWAVVGTAERKAIAATKRATTNDLPKDRVKSSRLMGVTDRSNSRCDRRKPRGHTFVLRAGHAKVRYCSHLIQDDTIGRAPSHR